MILGKIADDEPEFPLLFPLLLLLTGFTELEFTEFEDIVTNLNT